MKVLGATIIWVWWCVMMLMAVKTSSAAVEQQLGFTTVTLDLSNGLSGYSNFLTRLRNAVEAPVRACGLQSTRSTPLSGKEYVYVDLKISNTEWVTVGIDVRDLYVWGYKDNVKYNGQYRSTFFSNTPPAARESLFKDATTSRTTTFKSTYDSLESYAKVRRRDLVLGSENLIGAIRSVYKKPETELNNAAEAKFVLITIQMVAEAARFKFMEQAIINGDNSVEFKNKMVAFQNDWDPASQAIHKATPICTTISPTLIISNLYYRQEVNAVNEIKNDMGLLKYKDNALHTVTPSSILDDDDGVDNDRNLHLSDLR